VTALALHAEWTKLRTLPGMRWLPLAVAALTVAVGAAAGASFTCQGGSCAAALAGTDPAKVALAGVQASQALVAIVAVLAISGEYGNGMIRTTLTAMPRRLTVYAAKTAVVTGVVLGAAVIAVLASVLAGRLIMAGHGFTAVNGFGTPGHSLLSLADGTVLRAAAGSVLYLALIALLALGVATAVRDSAVAIGVVLALLFLFPVASHLITNPAWSRHLRQASPMTAGLYIQSTVNVHSLPLSPWQGLGVLALWALGALLLGGAVLRLRDA
jgi:ABC-2 type transport system permease protein